MICKKCKRFWADGMLDHLNFKGEGCPTCDYL
jgi:hypothetical protein